MANEGMIRTAGGTGMGNLVQIFARDILRCLGRPWSLYNAQSLELTYTNEIFFPFEKK